jgi:hypothetical protein
VAWPVTNNTRRGRVKFFQAVRMVARKSSSHAAAAREVVRDVFDGGEIGRRMIGSDAALVVAEDHVHPVAAYGRPDEMCQHGERGDIKPCLPAAKAETM